MKKPAAPKNERQAIKVTDPNDKRLKAYNDSNALYKTNVKLPADYARKPFVNKVNAKENKKDNISTGYSEKAVKGNIKPIAQYESKELDRYKSEVKKWADSGARGKAPEPPKGNKKYSVNNSKEKYGASDVYLEYKKPVQPYVLEKKKPTPKPKPTPTAKPPVATKVESSPKQPQKTVAKEDKKFYQGRPFMDSTGLRPSNYTKSEVNAAVAKKKKK